MSVSPDRIPLTAVILTKDEAVNIAPCLECLADVDDVVIVDSGSTDGTLELARKTRPDVRIFEHPFQDFGDQRNWALDQTQPKHEWVLMVDADEYCDAALLEEIAALIEQPGDIVGGFIAGRNYFLGRWLKHCTMYPSYQLRLLKLGEVRYRKEGHGQREVTDGPLTYLKGSWRHEGMRKGISAWIDRHNRYSTEEMELILRLHTEPLTWGELISGDPIVRRRAGKKVAARLPFQPIVRFVYQYVFKLGFLDGHPGLVFCMLRFAHDLHIRAKLEEERLFRDSSGR